jgi:D-alanyl-D-alanine carboxypeptidase
MAHTGSRLNRRRLVTSAAAAGVITATPLATQPAALAQRSTPAPLTHDLEATIAESIQAASIPGANVLVERPGSAPWIASLGVADIDGGTPMSPDMHMRLGSITKTMTATLVLQLVDEGTISLDDTLADVMPDISAFPDAREIPIRHLLNMRSGAFNYTEDQSIFRQMASEPTREWTPDELIDTTLAHDPYFEPGEGFHYSNTNYILLGMIVEQLTNRSLQESLDERLFAPIGMAHTSLPDTAELPSPFARGYGMDITSPAGATPAPGNLNALRDWTELNPTIAWAAGGVVSTLGDLQIWMRELTEGTLISESMQRERLSFTLVEQGADVGYGLGIGSYYGMVGHDGSIFGYEGFMGHDPDTDTSIIALINVSPSPAGASAFGLAMVIREALGTTP